MAENGNSIEYTARISDTPEYKSTQNSALLKLNLAENHREKVGNDWQDTKTATWHRVTAWNGRDEDLADILAENPAINKGALVRIKARYETRGYEKDGEKRTSFDETLISLKVIYPPKDDAPAVKAPSGDAF